MTKDEILGILAHPKEAKAFAKGEAIERKMTDGWCEQPDPKFWPHAFYRIKPIEHVEIRWVNIYNSHIGSTLYKSESEAQAHAMPISSYCITISITWTEGERLEG